MMHKDILVDLDACVDSYAFKYAADSLIQFCNDNNITLDDAMKMYIDLHPHLTNNIKGK